MSDAESTPVLPEKEEKPAPVETPEEKPTGNGETKSTDGEDIKDEPKAIPAKTEEPKNGAGEERKEPVKATKAAKDEPAGAKEVTSTPEKESPKKKTENDGEAEDVEESSSDEEPPLGLLERPVEVSGKRERKKTERLTMSGAFTPTDKKLEVPEGSGMKLGDIPRIEHFISKTSSEDCKILHRVIYGRPGTASMVKRNIRKFCGFTFSEDSAEFSKKKSNLAKAPVVELRRVAWLLDQERSGSREDIAERSIRFLLNPQDSGKPLPKKKTRSKGGPKKGTKRKRKSKKEGGDGDEEGGDDDDDADDDDDEESAESNKAESDAEEEEEKEKSETLTDNDDDDSDYGKPKKKKARTESPKKKKPTKTATAKPKKEKKEKKEKPKKEKKKAASKKKKVASSDDESSDDDQPLSKKSKKGPPTNEEIKELVKSILEGANLEEVTMKTVCKQVYQKYPDYDLTDRKDFIKSTVKQLIS